MALITVLKRLAGISPNDVEAAATALREVEAELSAAVAAFDAVSASFGADLVAAMTDGKPEAVESNLEAKRRAVDRLTRAREAVAERLQRALDAANADTLAVRWDAAEKALEARGEALVRLEQAAAGFGAALLAAEVAARKAWDAMPVKPSDGPHYLELAGEVPSLLALATEGRAGGYRGSMLWDLKQQPGMVARAEARGREWLRLRPASRSPNPPAAA